MIKSRDPIVLMAILLPFSYSLLYGEEIHFPDRPSRGPLFDHLSERPFEQESALSTDHIEESREQRITKKIIKPEYPVHEETNKIAITSDELIANPPLLIALLQQAFDQNNLALLKLLYPLYLQLPEEMQDPTALLYGYALLKTSEGEYKRAIEAYRHLLARNPDLAPMKYRLAQLLFINREYREAETLFQELAEESELPPAIQEQSRHFASAVQKRQKADLTIGTSLVNDRNINGGSHAEGPPGWRAIEPKSSYGLNYTISATKDLNLKGNHNIRFGANLYGQHYFNNRHYNDTIVRATTGYLYRDYQQSFGLLPFYEKRWYGGQPYSYGPGIQLNYQRLLTPQYQVATMAEYQYKSYDQNSTLNSEHYALSGTLVYAPSQDQFFFGGVNWDREKHDIKSRSYKRNAVRAGWGKQWQNNISTNIQASYALKEYDDTFFILFPKAKNHEYSANFSIWKRDFEIMGVTPRLNLNWQKVESNHFLHRYDRTRLFFDITKEF